MTKEQKNTARILIWAFVACTFLCTPFLRSPTLFDDFNIITPSNLDKIKSLGLDFSPRIWVYQTFALNQYFSGNDLESYRAFNLALHLLNSLAIFFLCREAMKQPAQKGALTKKNSDLNAALVAGLFALHPIAIFTQAYLIQRTILIATLAALCSTLFFLKGLRGSKGFFYLSALFCAISLYSKENSIALPAVLFLLSTVEAKRRKLSIWGFLRDEKHATASLLISGIFAISLVLRLKGLIGSNYEPLTAEVLEESSLLNGKNLYLLSILNQAKLFFYYVVYWVTPFPNDIVIDIRKPFPTQVLTPRLWLTAMPFIALNLFLIIKAIKNPKKAAYAFLAIPGILFITEFAATRIQENFVLYRSYLWAPFGFIALGIMLSKIELTKTKLTLFITLATLFFYSSCLTLVSLSNPYLAWDAARKIYEENDKNLFVPGGYRIYYNIGTILYDHKNLELSLENYDKALKLNSKYTYALMNRGIVFLDTQQWELALNDFEEASRLSPLSIKPLIGKAKSLKKLDRQTELDATLSELCRLSNENTCRETKEFVNTK
ncbi:tetratricopeptide repeat protein [Pseudomonas rhizoryzae]|uniref:tetratricopeptide repeat protein n=1 Tax=Pseudomonas rhizoryzae TaxID=2571129 RepID=UPI000A588C17|nr:hypothetical protein [Pseudomonas rhizoryzae]